MNLKKLLKSALFFISYYSGALHILISILKRLRKQHYVSILFYHRFSRKSPDGYHLPHLDIREFRKQMRHIKKWYRIITMDELAIRLAKGSSFTSPTVVIIIDDGFLSNYTLAYPVLKELNLRAIIYLTTVVSG